jgi:hypothetical protein
MQTVGLLLKAGRLVLATMTLRINTYSGTKMIMTLGEALFLLELGEFGHGYNPAHPQWYPLENVTYPGPRFCFYIHGWGKTHGCIAIESGNFDDFASTVNTHWPNATYIPLYVSYPVGNYTGVGGVIFPIDKLALLAPYIGLTSTIIVATVATVIYVKRVKHKKEKQ